MTDRDFMAEAIRLAVAAAEAPGGGPFGAVVVRGEEIVGTGWNQVTSAGDPTAHAEIVAIRDACTRLQTFQLTGCRMFSSCEPCPMCLGAILWARIDGLMYAATREDAAAAGFDDSEFYDELGRPPADRRLPVGQMMRDEAATAFERWGGNLQRVAY